MVDKKFKKHDGDKGLNPRLVFSLTPGEAQALAVMAAESTRTRPFQIRAMVRWSLMAWMKINHPETYKQLYGDAVPEAALTALEKPYVKPKD